MIQRDRKARENLRRFQGCPMDTKEDDSARRGKNTWIGKMDVKDRKMELTMARRMGRSSIWGVNHGAIF